MTEQKSSSGRRRRRRLLTPAEKYRVWLEVSLPSTSAQITFPRIELVGRPL